MRGERSEEEVWHGVTVVGTLTRVSQHLTEAPEEHWSLTCIDTAAVLGPFNSSCTTLQADSISQQHPLTSPRRCVVHSVFEL